MTNWYDPMTERWHKMPEPAKPIKQEELVPHIDDIYQLADKVNRIRTIWDAVVSTSTATQMAGTDGTGEDEADAGLVQRDDS